MGAFKRNRAPSEKKVIAAALCNTGYSYRAVASMLGGISYIGARDAYVAILTSLPEVKRRERREVALDGEDIDLDGKKFHLWLARDVGTGEIMTFHASPGPTAEDGARFLAEVGSMCTNKPIVKLGSGDRAPKEIANLDLYFQRTPPPSIIERIGKLLFPGNS